MWTSQILILVAALVKVFVYKFWIQFYGINFEKSTILIQVEQNVLHQYWVIYEMYVVFYFKTQMHRF